jgi:hypothetical protein
MQEKNNAKMMEMQQNLMQTQTKMIERFFKSSGKKLDNCDSLYSYEIDDNYYIYVFFIAL